VDLFGQKLKKKIFMNEIKVEIVADSINQQGDRLTSLVLTYPRIIHAEMLTHRMFSRNASSSRAVPVQKMIEAVKNNTFCPFEFQKAHKGMQGTEYFTGQDKEDCIKLWLESAELALQQAEKMKEKGITKQIINRILEPYQYYTVLITGSKEGWDNFFSLRSPSYEIGVNKFKSKKDVLDYYSDEPNYIELKNYTDLDWLQLNKGQAEIHMMMLAEKIYDAMNESTPKQLKPGEWHIPFYEQMDETKLFVLADQINKKEQTDLCQDPILNKEFTAIKVSIAMAARTSYTLIGDEKELDYEKLNSLYEKLLNQYPPHSSPFEHCCQCLTEEEYNSSFKTVGFKYGKAITEKGWVNNYHGFKSYRSIIENY
jgi:thymidylate synthase ThyX